MIINPTPNLDDVLYYLLVEQVEIEAPVCFRGRILRLQHCCANVLGNPPLGFQCQYDTPYGGVVSHLIVLHSKVNFLTQYSWCGSSQITKKFLEIGSLFILGVIQRKLDSKEPASPPPKCNKRIMKLHDCYPTFSSQQLVMKYRHGRLKFG